MEKIFCIECGKEMEYSGRGRPHKRHKDCNYEHRKKYHRNYWIKNKERYKLSSKGSGVGYQLLSKQLKDKYTEVLEDSDFPTHNEIFMKEDYKILDPDKHDRELNGSYELQDDGKWLWISDEEEKKIEKELKDLKKKLKNWKYWN